jgi:mannose-6-phosphate isomerase
MAASDNVLRGGLTPKHIDVPELLSVLDFTPGPVPYLVPERPADGVELYRPDVPDFELVRVVATDEVSPTVRLPGAAIAIATAGALTLTGASGRVDLGQGDAVYVTPDEESIAVGGVGELFVATTRL